MKHFNKALSIILILLLMLSYFSLLSLADEVLIEGDYEYTVTDEEATITKYIGEDSDVTVPSMLGGFPVTAIGDYAFSLNSILTSVTIPDGVVHIGLGAFAECTNFVRISIPASVESFGDGSFLSCGKLTDITLPQGITKISNEKFARCSS